MGSRRHFSCDTEATQSGVSRGWAQVRLTPEMYTPSARYGEAFHAWIVDSGGAVQASNASPL